MTALDVAGGYDALRHHVGVAPLGRDVVLVDGADAEGYLQGQLSQDVAGLAVGGTTWSFVLQPQGKVDALLRVHRLAGDAFLLDTDAGAGEALVARLRRFLLRTDARVEPITDAVVVAVRGPSAAEIEVEAEGELARVPCGWPGVVGVDVIAHVVALEDLPLVPDEALEAVRIEAGVPVMGRELSERTIPAEAGAWVIDAAVSFTKGCYTGQELVARIDSRGGHVPRPVRGLVVDGPELPPIGAVLRTGDGAEVGALTSVCRSPALGIVALAPTARDVEPPAAVEVVWDGGRAAAEVRVLPLVGGSPDLPSPR